MRIEQLTENDLHEFAIAYRDYFNADGDKWTWDRAYKRLHQMWSIEDSICLKAQQDDRICGILMSYLDWFDDGPCCHILEVLILKEYQCCGIGSALMREAECIAKSKGATVAILETLNDKTHERFYGRLGYTTRENLICKVRKL